MCNNFKVHNFYFFLTVETERSAISASSLHRRKQTMSIFRTQQRFLTVLLPAAKSAMHDFVDVSAD